MEQVTSFGYWVRRQRKALDLTQATLAQQVGCTLVTVKKIERDERRPSREMAELLADHLAIAEADRDKFIKMARGQWVDGAVAPNAPVEQSTALSSTPHALPPQPTSFVGREAELARLNTLLADPDKRLATILGPGGIGKTRLCLAAAEAQIGSDQFTDGVSFVPLASVYAAAKSLMGWDKANEDIKLGAIGRLTQSGKGKVKTKRYGGGRAGRGALIGGAVGLLAAGVTGGLSLLGGAIGGGASGKLTKGSFGLDDASIEKIKHRLDAGHTALVVLRDDYEVKPTMAELESAGGETESFGVSSKVLEAIHQNAIDNQMEETRTRDMYDAH